MVDGETLDGAAVFHTTFSGIVTLLLVVRVSAEMTEMLMQLQLVSSPLRPTISLILWLNRSTSSIPVVAFPRG